MKTKNDNTTRYLVQILHRYLAFMFIYYKIQIDSYVGQHEQRAYGRHLPVHLYLQQQQKLPDVNLRISCNHLKVPPVVHITSLKQRLTDNWFARE
jgi:hypothetical protein